MNEEYDQNKSDRCRKVSWHRREILLVSTWNMIKYNGCRSWLAARCFTAVPYSRWWWATRSGSTSRTIKVLYCLYIHVSPSTPFIQKHTTPTKHGQSFMTENTLHWSGLKSKSLGACRKATTATYSWVWWTNIVPKKGKIHPFHPNWQRKSLTSLDLPTT